MSDNEVPRSPQEESMLCLLEYIESEIPGEGKKLRHTIGAVALAVARLTNVMAEGVALQRTAIDQMRGYTEPEPANIAAMRCAECGWIGNHRPPSPVKDLVETMPPCTMWIPYDS